MKFDFETTSLNDDFKFRVRYELKDNFTNQWAVKLAKQEETFPDDDLVESYIRKYVEPNIILDIWKINPEHKSSFCNTQSWVGQYFIAPVNWKEEIIARLMQLSTDLVETIICEIIIKTKKAIWDLAKKKEASFLNLNEEKVKGNMRRAAAEALNQKIAILNKKEEEKAKNRKAEKEVVSPIWEIIQESALGTLKVKLQYFGLAPKDFAVDLSLIKTVNVEDFARIFLKKINVDVEWKGAGNEGKLTRVFENMHNTPDVNASIFKFITDATGIPVICTSSSSFSCFLEKFSRWIEEQRRIYIEQFCTIYKLEFDPANNSMHCAFKIKKENTSEEMTIVLFAKKEFSFKDVLSEIVVFSQIDKFTSRRYTMVDLKEYRNLFSFLTAEVASTFNDSRAASAFTSEDFETINTWINDISKSIKEKKESQSPKDSYFKAFYSFKAKFTIEGVHFEFSTQVDAKSAKLKKLNLDDIARALTENETNWNIDFLDESCNCHVTFNTSVVRKCKDYEEFFEYFKKLMHRSKIEFSNEDSYRRALLKLVDLFTSFVEKKSRPIIPKEKTAQDLLVDEVSKGIQRMKELFDLYVESESETERLKARWDFASLYNKLIG